MEDMLANEKVRLQYAAKYARFGKLLEVFHRAGDRLEEI